PYRARHSCPTRRSSDLHPRNAFWRIMSEHFEFDVHAPYAERAARLRAHRVAVWDVVESCSRASSLDSDIQSASVVPNDFEAFFEDRKSTRLNSSHVKIS